MKTVSELRQAMVSEQLVQRGIKDERVLGAMGELPRHQFVPAVSLKEAYADHPIPIGHGQTISQPYMVAKMTEILAPQADQRVLEVGSGCGYQTALLSALAKHVYAIEIIEKLSVFAGDVLGDLALQNVSMTVGDGGLGWASEAPFDAILVAAGAPSVPGPLTEQLADGGRLVIPVGDRQLQELVVVTRRGAALSERRDIGCRFVNLVGQHGWSAA